MVWLHTRDVPALPRSVLRRHITRRRTLGKKLDGRQGPPSTIINLRLPVALVARLDRYIDDLETHTGLKAHRGMIARRALELFLETHEPG